MLNTVALVGNLGHDPELRFLPNGTAVANARIAINDPYKDSGGNKIERTYWIPIVIWGKTAEIFNQYCSKGSRLGVVGSIQSRDWEDKDGNKRSTIEVKVNSLELLGTKKESGASQGPPPHGVAGTQPPPDPGAAYEDDDIPF